MLDPSTARTITGYGHGYGNGATVPPLMAAGDSAVSQQVNRLAGMVSENRKLIEDAGERLSCITGAVPEKDTGGHPEPPNCMLGPLANSLRELAKQVEEGNAVFRRLLARLEI